MRKIFLLMFLLVFVACNKDGTPTDSNCDTPAVQAQNDDGTLTPATDCTVTTPPVSDDDDDDQTPLPPVNGSLPTEAYTFDTNIVFLNTNATQQKKFDDAIELIKKVVATEEFRDKILNHTYNGKKTFVDNGGFTNAQIYQKILDGAETLRPAKNNTMDMEVELYYTNNSTVGYTYANVTKIWVNTKFFYTNTVPSVAANLMHEWLHKVGFKHATSYSTSRDYSVPYAIGRMVSSIGKNL